MHRHRLARLSFNVTGTAKKTYHRHHGQPVDACDGPVHKLVEKGVFQAMLEIENRQKSFLNRNLSQFIIQNAHDICTNGYFASEDLSIKCAGCHVSVENPVNMEQLQNAHESLCQFHNSLPGPSVRNKETDAMNHFKTKQFHNKFNLENHEDYLKSCDLADKNQRSSTFYEIADEETKQRYANSGLFYLGRGRAQCIFCGNVFKISENNPELVIRKHEKINAECIQMQTMDETLPTKPFRRSNSNSSSSIRKRSRTNDKQSSLETTPMVTNTEQKLSLTKSSSMMSNYNEDRSSVSMHSNSMEYNSDGKSEFVSALEEPLNRTRINSEPMHGVEIASKFLTLNPTEPFEETTSTAPLASLDPEPQISINSSVSNQQEHVTSNPQSFSERTSDITNQGNDNQNNMSFNIEPIGSFETRPTLDQNLAVFTEEERSSMVYQPEENMSDEEFPVVNNPTPPSGVVMVSIRQSALVPNDNENDTPTSASRPTSQEPTNNVYSGEYTPVTSSSSSLEHVINSSALLNREVIGAVASEERNPRSGRWDGFYPCAEPRVAHMTNYNARLQSFINWPRFSVMAPPSAFATAGFFYLGEETRVRCFYCYGGIQNWLLDDDPWLEHAKYYPTCEYLLSQRGPEFVSDVVARYPDLDAPMSYELPRPPPRRVAVVDPREEGSKMHEKLENAMKSETVNKAEELGFNRHTIKKALKTFIYRNMTSDLPTDVNEYLDLLLQFADVTASSDEEESNCEDMEPTTSIQRRSVEGAASTFVPPENVAQSLQEIQVEKRCKVCLDKDADVVFIPCGHLCTCKDCAEALVNCPLCRKQITKAIKTYYN